MTKSTSTSMNSLIGLIFTALIFSVPAEAAKKKPNSNTPIKVINVVPNTAKNTPKSHVKRKQMVSSMKATLKRGKKTLKSARKDLAAVVKSEKRNRKDRLKAKQAKDNALFAMRANTNPQTTAAYNRALQAYLPVRERHESSIKSASAQLSRVNQLANFQVQALNAKRTAKKNRPRQGTPAAINRSPQFVRPRSAYDRVHPASLLPAPPTGQPGRYQGQLSPLAQALNNNRYGLIQNLGGNTLQQQNVGNNGGYTPAPTPAFTY
jgi:hypothetical protein